MTGELVEILQLLYAVDPVLFAPARRQVVLLKEEADGLDRQLEQLRDEPTGLN